MAVNNLFVVDSLGILRIPRTVLLLLPLDKAHTTKNKANLRFCYSASRGINIRNSTVIMTVQQGLKATKERA